MEAHGPVATAKDLAQTYLDALQAKDKGTILSILADEFVLEVPCNVSGTNDFSDSWRGIETASEKYDDTFEKIEVLQYTEIEIFGGSDGTVAFAEGLGVMRMATGLPYENRYVFRFDAEDGKITRIREYLNPVTSAIAFGIPLPRP